MKSMLANEKFKINFPEKSLTVSSSNYTLLKHNPLLGNTHVESWIDFLSRMKTTTGYPNISWNQLEYEDAILITLLCDLETQMSQHKPESENASESKHSPQSPTLDSDTSTVPPAFSDSEPSSAALSSPLLMSPDDQDPPILPAYQAAKRQNTLSAPSYILTERDIANYFSLTLSTILKYRCSQENIQIYFKKSTIGDKISSMKQELWEAGITNHAHPAKLRNIDCIQLTITAPDRFLQRLDPLTCTLPTTRQTL